MKIFYTLIFILSFVTVLGQKNIDFTAENFPDKKRELKTIKTSINRGNLLLENENYAVAKNHFKEAFEFNPNNAEVNHKLGFCFLKLKTELFGLSYLKQAMNLTDDASIELKYDLARSYHLNSEFIKAIELYKEVKQLSNSSEFDKFILECESGIELTKSSNTKIRFVNLGGAVNSKYNDYGAYVLFDNILYFTSSRSISDIKDKDDDIYYSVQTDSGRANAVRIDKTVNTIGNDAIIGVNNKTKTMYLFADDNNGDIFYTVYQDSLWSVPLRLNQVLSSEYLETSPCFTDDDKTLYFISDREGTIGKKDVFVSTKKQDGSWSIPRNLGKTINTVYNEQSLFLSGDTMFFASQGHNSMGGYDIFMSVRDNYGNFSAPENLGVPFNTPSDDLFYFQNNQDKLISSDRLGTLGQSDIFGLEDIQIAVVSADTTSVSKPKEVHKDGVNLVFVRNVSFEINKYENINAYPVMDTIAKFMLDNPNAKISIFGYTDMQGNDDYNMRLSVKRADFVKKYLISKGVSEKSITVEGRGEANQISTNTDKNNNYIWKSLPYNRRVEFVVTQQGANNQLVIEQIDVPDEYKLNNYREFNGYFSIRVNSFDKSIDIADEKIFERKCDDGTFDYFYGKFDSYSDANEQLIKLRNKYKYSTIVFFSSNLLF